MIFLHYQRDLWEQAAQVSHGLNISVMGRKLFLLALSLCKALWTQWDPACPGKGGKGELGSFRNLELNSFQHGGTCTWWMWAVQALMAQEHDCHEVGSFVAANRQGRQARDQLRFPLGIFWLAGVPSLVFLNECAYPYNVFCSDKLAFSHTNVFHRKMSEQLSVWFIKPSDLPTQESMCEFMPQLRWMEAPDLLSPLCSISPTSLLPAQAANIHQPPSGHSVHLDERWWKLEGVVCSPWTVGLELCCFFEERSSEMWKNRQSCSIVKL